MDAFPSEESATPTWLLAMEHGVLGEARAKAFLLDRFWVLERSVDIHGADLLVQLKGLRESALDRANSRVGYVQAKFIQDERTAVVIPSVHVRDANGNAYEEFFLVVSNGVEDSSRLFLLSAGDICDTFEESGPPDKRIFRLSGRQLLRNSNFEVGSTRVALSKIEHSLKGASLTGNRRYIRSMGATNVTLEQIDVDFVSPLQNWWGDIPRAFYAQRMEARRLLFELEGAAVAVDALLQATNPAEAGAIFDEHLSGMLTGDGHLTFHAIGIMNQDLVEVARDEIAHLGIIRSLGIESAYFSILAAFDDEAIRFANMQPRPAGDSIHAEINYRMSDLKSVSVELTAHDSRCDGQDELHGYATVVQSRRGSHTICFDASHTVGGTAWPDPRRDPALFHLPFQLLLDRALLETPVPRD